LINELFKYNLINDGIEIREEKNYKKNKVGVDSINLFDEVFDITRIIE
jgi:hypothetical protein